MILLAGLVVQVQWECSQEVTSGHPLTAIEPRFDHEGRFTCAVGQTVRWRTSWGTTSHSVDPPYRFRGSFIVDGEVAYLAEGESETPILATVPEMKPAPWERGAEPAASMSRARCWTDRSPASGVDRRTLKWFRGPSGLQDETFRPAISGLYCDNDWLIYRYQEAEDAKIGVLPNGQMWSSELLVDGLPAFWIGEFGSLWRIVDVTMESLRLVDPAASKNRRVGKLSEQTLHAPSTVASHTRADGSLAVLASVEGSAKARILGRDGVVLHEASVAGKRMEFHDLHWIADDLCVAVTGRETGSVRQGWACANVATPETKVTRP